MARTTSTSRMTGTGFIKWIPTTRSGRPEAMPRLAIEIEDVLLARRVDGSQTCPNCANSARFMTGSSGIASITTCASRNRCMCFIGCMIAMADPA